MKYFDNKRVYIVLAVAALGLVSAVVWFAALPATAEECGGGGWSTAVCAAEQDAMALWDDCLASPNTICYTCEYVCNYGENETCTENQSGNYQHCRMSRQPYHDY